MIWQLLVCSGSIATNGIHTQCVITNNLRKEKNNDRRNENSTAKQRR